MPTNDANPPPRTPETRPSDTSSTVDEDVRRLYAEANRNPNSIAALTHGRRAAEAVCQALGERLPANLRDRFRGKALNGQLGILEDNVEGVPRHVLAGLRTLQAYGNYASHYNQGEHVPPVPATESAFASLALVVHWFLGKLNPLDAPEATSLAALLRSPAPGVPSVITRWRLRFEAGQPPTLDTRATSTEFSDDKFSIAGEAGGDDEKLLVLRGYYSASKRCTGSRSSRGSVPRSSRGSARDARMHAAISGVGLMAYSSEADEVAIALLSASIALEAVAVGGQCRGETTSVDDE